MSLCHYLELRQPNHSDILSISVYSSVQHSIAFNSLYIQSDLQFSEKRDTLHMCSVAVEPVALPLVFFQAQEIRCTIPQPVTKVNMWRVSQMGTGCHAWAEDLLRLLWLHQRAVPASGGSSYGPNPWHLGQCGHLTEWASKIIRMA